MCGFISPWSHMVALQKKKKHTHNTEVRKSIGCFQIMSDFENCG